MSSANPIASIAASASGASVPGPVRVLLRPFVERMRGAIDERRLAAMDHPVGNPWTVKVGKREHRFFFLSGCYKSGTHWVSNLLNLHPRVNITGEFHFTELLETFRTFTSRSWYMGAKPAIRPVAVEAMQNLIRRCVYAATRDKPEALWLGDHTPRPMEPILPGAPRVVVTRDGRDVLISFAFHLLRARIPEELHESNRDLAIKFCPLFQQDPERFKNPNEGFLGDDEWVRRTASGWAGYLRQDREEAQRNRAEGGRVHEVQYEQLHRDIERKRADLYRFFDLDPADAAPISAETKTTPGFKSENITSFFRKGQAGDWKNYFDERLTRLFKEGAGDALVEAGYERDNTW